MLTSLLNAQISELAPWTMFAPFISRRIGSRIRDLEKHAISGALPYQLQFGMRPLLQNGWSESRDILLAAVALKAHKICLVFPTHSLKARTT